MPTLADLEALRAQDTGPLSNAAQAYRTRGSRGAPGGFEEFTGGLKHTLDSAALGIKKLLPQSVQDFGDSVDRAVGAGGVNEDLVKQGKAFVDETGPLSTAGAITGDVGIGLAPGAGILKGARILKNALKLRGLTGGAAVLGTEAAGNAAVNAAIEPEDRTKAAAIGAGGSVVGSAANRLLSGPLANAVTAQAKKLMDSGVRPTVGQMLTGEGSTAAGRTFRRAEDAIGSIPFIGDAIKHRAGGAVEDFNVASLNDVLKPLGDKVTKSGTEGIAEAKQILRDKYDSVIDKVHMPVETAKTFVSDMEEAFKHMSLLDDKQRNFIERLVDLHITPEIKRAEAAGAAITGQTARELDRALEKEATRFRTKGGAWDQHLADALDQLQKGWRDNIAGIADTADKETFDQIAAASTRIKPMIEAGARSNTGTFTPKQLVDELRKSNMPINSQTQAARHILPDTVPDSGTGLRQAVYQMLHPAGLAGAAGTAAAVGLGGMTPFALAGAGVAGAYTKTGTDYLAKGIKPLLEKLRGKKIDQASMETVIKLLSQQGARATGNVARDDIALGD